MMIKTAHYQSLKNFWELSFSSSVQVNWLNFKNWKFYWAKLLHYCLSSHCKLMKVSIKSLKFSSPILKKKRQNFTLNKWLSQSKIMPFKEESALSGKKDKLQSTILTSLLNVLLMETAKLWSKLWKWCNSWWNIQREKLSIKKFWRLSVQLSEWSTIHC